jgi:S1/P1 Nuclease
MRSWSMTIVLAIALLVPQYALTWNGRGHMMVAAVAYQKLNQATKDRVDSLLLLNPDRDNWLDLIPASTPPAKVKMVFMVAATWADRIKSDPDYHTDGTHNGNRPPNDPTAGQNIGYDDLARHKDWHFVDLPFSDDNTTLPSVPAPNTGTQIAKFRAVLNSVSNDPNVDKLKSYDLSWLLHLVGDLHQPLHSTTRVSATDLDGDDGGNGVKLTSPANLHTFWDGVLGGGDAPWTALNAIVALQDAPKSAANDLNVSDWIKESFDAAEHTAYKSPPIGAGAGPFTLTMAYGTAARNLAQKRIALAGARLAKLLNEELR